ncbi:MAG TPA: GntR family transcriptional regulator [Bryobacteraceae bacterium]|nr:GntR family transcriptional regulator [Bryobacteraceae bacterium]
MASPDTAVAGKLAELSHKLGRRTPVADQIAGSIRAMIVAGDLKPGDRVVESRIARQIGVGQPTVREALVALEHQGLVVRKANQGCVVTVLTRAEISQILRVREQLEGMAIELAMDFAPDSEIQKLVDAAIEMQEAAAARDIERFFDADVEFHEILWRLSGNFVLPKLLAQTLMPVLAFLFMRNLRDRSELQLSDAAAAHVEIAQAILQRDREAARQVAQQKFRLFAEQHLSWYRSEG